MLPVVCSVSELIYHEESLLDVQAQSTGFACLPVCRTYVCVLTIAPSTHPLPTGAARLLPWPPRVEQLATPLSGPAATQAAWAVYRRCLAW